MSEKSEAKMPLTNALLLLQQFSSVLPLGITVCDLEGNVFYKNDIYTKWMPGHSSDNSLWFNQMLPYLSREQQPDITYFDTPVHWLLDHVADRDVELASTYQGQKIFFKLRFYPLMDDKNKLCGLIEVTENITEQKQTEQSLEHSRRFETVGRLASGIAHDFNNILQVINGHSEMLIESRKEDSKLMHSLEIILTSGQKASALTRQLLLFSRRQATDFKQMNLGSHIQSMHKILARMLGEDITMSIQCKDQEICIEADESRMEQIIMNLAINARDAMPEGGTIKIVTDYCEIDPELMKDIAYNKQEKFVCLSFTDSGTGIPQDDLEHIFEPFFSTKEVGKGTGLGLATIYNIVKQHKGYIFVQSAPGAGTTFKVYFPRCEATLKAAEECLAYTPQSGCKKHVLVVEDDDKIQELAEQVLTRYDYLVTCAYSLAQAKDFSQKNTYDLFLIDIVLPDGNGADLIETLEGKNAQAAFILSSGYTEDKPQIKNTIYKGYAFLHKPFTINSLLRACSEALHDHKST